MSGLAHHAARSLLGAIIILALVLPFTLIALAQARPEHKKLGYLAFAAAFFLIYDAMLLMPPLGVFQSLTYNWQDKLLAAAGTLLVIWLWNDLTWQEVGVTNKFNAGWKRPVIITIIVFLTIELLFVNGRGGSSIEEWLFQLTIPGLDEELVFRGLLLALTNRVFGKPWRFAGTKIGWGFILTTLLFGFGHVVSLDKTLHVSLVWTELLTLIPGFALAYVRERSGSVWIAVIFHNLSDTTLVAAGYLPAW